MPFIDYASSQRPRFAQKTRGSLALWVASITLFLLQKPPVAVAQRIVSLLPSNTEIVDALGAGASVVGVTVFESRKAGRTTVGDFINPSVERIVSLRPDLILAGRSQNAKALSELKRLGLPVVEVSNPASLDELFRSIRTVAEALHESAQADAVIDRLKRQFQELKEAAPRRPWRTYIEIDAPLWTIGGRDFLSEALCDLGGCNIFADLKHPAAQVAAETIVARDPELIISLDASKEEMARRPGWSQITAVRRGWIIDRHAVDPDRLVRPSPRLIEGLQRIAQLMTQLRTPS